jgi:hypothetical protein
VSDDRYQLFVRLVDVLNERVASGDMPLDAALNVWAQTEDMPAVELARVVEQLVAGDCLFDMGTRGRTPRRWAEGSM